MLEIEAENDNYILVLTCDKYKNGYYGQKKEFEVAQIYLCQMQEMQKQSFFNDSCEEIKMSKIQSKEIETVHKPESYIIEVEETAKSQCRKFEEMSKSKLDIFEKIQAENELEINELQKSNTAQQKSKTVIEDIDDIKIDAKEIKDKETKLQILFDLFVKKANEQSSPELLNSIAQMYSVVK
ncbi:Conserved_hypothetical protein [Hexamita inflata]|nr:Conserved hypothetical protein [Hexamita inflata]